jgi:hypothetical protein
MSTAATIKAALLGSPLERLDGKIKKLNAERVRLESSVEANERALSADLLADDDEPFNAARTAAHRRVLADEREQLATINFALSEAANQRAGIELAERKKARELRCEDINARESAHLAKVKKMHVSLAAFAADYRAVLESNEQRFNSLVTVPDPDAAMLYTALIETATRQEMVKLGLPWAFSWPWGEKELPDFAAKFEAVPALVKVWTETGKVA